ncbi:MAG: metallophosphoesterase [Chloroflexota bacterium]
MSLSSKRFNHTSPFVAAIVACMVVLSAIGVTWVSPSAVASEIVRFVKGPYLQSVTTNSAIVCWEADSVHSGTVVYGTDLEYSHIARSERKDESHSVRLPALKPHARYFYKVLVEGADSSPGASFVTLAGPDQEDIAFVALSDTQTNHPVHGALVNLIKATAPDFVIHMGDVVETGRHGSDWNVFFMLERGLLSSIPIYPALGNHDENSPIFFSLFVLPGNERWYIFDSGPAHFVALDVVFSDYEPGSEQYAWLEQDLENTTRPWKIVYFHFPPYHFSSYRSGDEGVRKALTPLFERQGVQLVLSGHNHSYQRNVVNGVTYVVAAGGGGRLYPVGKGPFTVYTESVHHFLKIAINGRVLTSTAVRRDGSEFDRFSLRLPIPQREWSELLEGVRIPTPVVSEPPVFPEDSGPANPQAKPAREAVSPVTPEATPVRKVGDSAAPQAALAREVEDSAMPEAVPSSKDVSATTAQPPETKPTAETTVVTALADGWDSYRPFVMAGAVSLVTLVVWRRRRRR